MMPGESIYSGPNERFGNVSLKARLSSSLYCPKGCDYLLCVSEDRKTLTCVECKSVYAMPTVEIQEIHPKGGE